MGGASVVLGGGGVVGMAWETGLLAGLAEAGCDLGAADEVIGTSAGSVTGTWLASGRDFGPLAEAQRAGDGAIAVAPAGGQAIPDEQRRHLAEMFATWSAIEHFEPQHGRELGRIAHAAPTGPEAAWIASIERQLDTADWPAALRVTAVDTQSGELRVFARSSGVPLVRAVAASCTVPAFFPPVVIEGRPYIDGGIASGTHADLALARRPDRVLVITPFDRRSPGIGAVMERQRDEELSRLRDAGVEVSLIAPSPEAFAAMGPNFMDASRRAAAVDAGAEQGRREAASPALKTWRDVALAP
jgi:NTE family protein